jgi:hypothetical protein
MPPRHSLERTDRLGLKPRRRVEQRPTAERPALSAEVALRACLKTRQTSQTTHHQMDHGHTDHRVARLGQIFVIFGSSAIPAEPPEGALHNPALRQGQNALDPSGPFDHVQANIPPGPERPHPGEAVTGRGLIRPDQPPSGKPAAEDVSQQHGSIAILHTSGRDHYGQEQPSRLDEDVTFAAIDVFRGIIAVDPPFSVVLTDGLSMIPALGCRCVPTTTRTSPRSMSCRCCQVPSSRQTRTSC